MKYFHFLIFLTCLSGCSDCEFADVSKVDIVFEPTELNLSQYSEEKISIIVKNQSTSEVYVKNDLSNLFVSQNKINGEAFVFPGYYSSPPSGSEFVVIPKGDEFRLDTFVEYGEKSIDIESWVIPLTGGEEKIEILFAFWPKSAGIICSTDSHYESSSALNLNIK